MTNIYRRTILRPFCRARNFIGRKTRKGILDLSLLIILLLVGLFMAFEFDIYGNQQGVTKHEQTIELNEALTLGSLLAVGLLIFAARRFAEQKREMQRRIDETRTRAEQETAHMSEVSAMQRRTIETLALAVESKDQTTHDHLQRVETYAVEVGKEMGFDDKDIATLRVAALLHDIGKLAVPEYIIAKPGKLSRDEFATMKTHTVVGAAIVERMCFPFEVASLVRGHHEKWDGSGYPDGLVGEGIPLGARILAAVDCLDAMCSDRPYRRAMPLTAAIELIRAEAGKSFDPRVVEILSRRYVDLAAKVECCPRIEGLPFNVTVSRGNAPAAGFEKVAVYDEFTHNLLALAHAGNLVVAPAPSVERSITTVEDDMDQAILERLKTSLCTRVPWDAMVVYLRCGDSLSSVTEDNVGDFRMVLANDIRVGEGLSGWVVENRKAIVNGNPSVEPGYTKRPSAACGLHSALAVPLIAASGVVGVLSLYRKEYDAFSTQDLEVATSAGSAFAAILETIGSQALTPQS
jgi:putative nucleotidyltransferase with HDIG domain